MADVLIYALGDGEEWGVIAHGTELGKVSFGEILVLMAHCVRHFHIFYFGLETHRAGDTLGNSVIAGGTTSTHVEDSADLWMFEHPEHYVDAIANPHKVAPLLAVGTVVTIGPKQANNPLFPVLFEEMTHNAHLSAFVVLIGTIDIEELETHNLWAAAIVAVVCGNKLIHRILAPAVGIERSQLREMRKAIVVMEAEGSIAVGSCGRRIDQRDSLLLTKVEKACCELEIISHKAIHVGLGSAGDGSKVENHLNVGGIGVEKSVELLREEEPQGRTFGHITPFVAVAKSVDGNNVVITFLLQGGQQVGAYKACGASYYDHDNENLYLRGECYFLTPITSAVPLTATPLTEATRLAVVDTRPLSGFAIVGTVTVNASEVLRISVL